MRNNAGSATRNIARPRESIGPTPRHGSPAADTATTGVI